MEIPENVKKYAPYAVGGVIGLILISKMIGGKSQPVQSQSSEYVNPAMYATQLQAGLQSSALSAQTQLARDTLSAQVTSADNQAQVAFLSAQGEAVGQAANSASQLITALTMPTMMAINSSNAADSQMLSDTLSVLALNSSMANNHSDQVRATSLLANVNYPGAVPTTNYMDSVQSAIDSFSSGAINTNQSTGDSLRELAGVSSNSSSSIAGSTAASAAAGASQTASTSAANASATGSMFGAMSSIAGVIPW